MTKSTKSTKPKKRKKPGPREERLIVASDPRSALDVLLKKKPRD